MLITCAVDLNGFEEDARVDYEVLAHSMSGSTYSIDHGSIGTFQRGLSEENREKWTYFPGYPNSVWPKLTEVLKKDYLTTNDELFHIAICGIDTGSFTQLAYQFIDTGSIITGPGTECLLVGLKGDPEEKNRRRSADTPFYREARERNDLQISRVKVRYIVSHSLKGP